MKLEGSCHCGAVRFRVVSRTPYPYNRCYCTICRKTAGGGGYAVNIMGLADTLEVEGEDAVRVYRARGNERNTSKRTAGARRGAISAAPAAARSGYGTPAGRKRSIPSPRRSTRRCRARRSIRGS